MQTAQAIETLRQLLRDYAYELEVRGANNYANARAKQGMMALQALHAEIESAKADTSGKTVAEDAKADTSDTSGKTVAEG
jgi:hypothetical protein